MQYVQYCQHVASAVCLLVAPLALLSAEEMVPLKLTYPPAMAGFSGHNELGTNVERYDGAKAAVALLVPQGTTNVALHKPVTSNTGTTNLYANLAHNRQHPSDISMGAPTNLNWITSGDKHARLAEHLWVGSRKQWIQIDLGGEVRVYAVALWHCYYYLNEVFNNVVVQVCDKPDFQENVITIFNNDTDNELGLGAGKDRLYCETRWGKLIDARGIKGRYVRLYSNGSNLGKINYYLQVEVYGK
jgi:hypothetical protein